MNGVETHKPPTKGAGSTASVSRGSPQSSPPTPHWSQNAGRENQRVSPSAKWMRRSPEEQGWEAAPHKAMLPNSIPAECSPYTCCPHSGTVGWRSPVPPPRPLWAFVPRMGARQVAPRKEGTKATPQSPPHTRPARRSPGLGCRQWLRT